MTKFVIVAENGEHGRDYFYRDSFREAFVKAKELFMRGWNIQTIKEIYLENEEDMVYDF